MDTADIIRKVQRAIGDDNEILILKTDIVDWINDAQLTVAREVGFGRKELVNTVADYVDGLLVADLLLVKRVIFKDNALAMLDRETLDRMSITSITGQYPVGYYMEGPYMFLYPSGNQTDPITLIYVPAPIPLVTEADPVGLPFNFHEDIVSFCKMRANERNENYRAAEYNERQFRDGVSQRKFDTQTQDDSFATVGPDYMDFEDVAYYDGL